VTYKVFDGMLNFT